MDEAQARATLDAALDAGWTLLDTAESYLQSEERLGRMLRGRREDVFIATKAFPCEPYTLANLNAALENSLRRLQTDHVDLFQLHGPQDWVMPLPPIEPDLVAEALASLVTSGKAARVGVCNLPLPELQALSERTPIFATQNLYSMIDRGTGEDSLHLPVEAEILPYAEEHGIAVMVWSPLSRGLLSDSLTVSRTYGLDDERRLFPRFRDGIFEHYVALADSLRAWANDHGRTLTQLAVAWVLQNPAVKSVLIGAKSPAQVAAFVGADDWHLNKSQLAELESLIASGLPSEARDAKMVYLDHVTPAILESLRASRHA
jgi:aryl-alcohol dehydrogenase-like predicted oxidoreductase